MNTIERPVIVRRRASLLFAFAVAGGVFANSLRAADYDWSNFNTALPQNWANAGNWSPLAFPGDTAGNLSDVANIILNGSMPGLGGTLTINYTGTPAGTIGGLTLSVNNSNQTATDAVALNINAPLAVTGSAVITTPLPSFGRAVLNVSSALSVGGVMTTNAASLYNILPGGSVTGGTLDVSSTGVTLNATSGTATFTSVTANTGGLTFLGSGSLTVTNAYTTSASNSKNLTINTTGSATFGTITIGRTLGANVDLNDPSANIGVHIQQGLVSAGGFLIGTSDSAAAAEIAGGTLTVTGSEFAVGRNTGGKLSGIFVDGGTLIGTNAAGLVVGRGAGANPVGGSGIFQVSAGTATLEKLTLGGTLTTNNANPGLNKGSLSLSGTGTLYLGAGGLVATTGNAINFSSVGSEYGVVLSGGTLGAKADWASSANMALSNTPTFQAADAFGAPFNIRLTGRLSNAGTITKTGAGTLTLTNSSNSFTGGVNVNAGTLLVDAPSGTALNTGPVSVTAGGALGGVGNIATIGTISIGTGGHITPGIPTANSGIGTFNANSLSFATGAFIDMDVGVVSNDNIMLLPGATLSLGNSVNVNVFTAGSFQPYSVPGTYTLFTNVGSIVGDPVNLHVVNGNGSAAYHFSLAGSALVMTISPSAPGNGTWIAGGGSEWTPAGNWANGSVPGANAGESATFGLGTVPSSIALNGVRRLGNLTFNAAAATGYTLAAGTGGKLFLDNGSSSAAVTVYLGNHTISADTEYTSNVTISVLDAASILTFSGTNAAPANSTLLLNGPGTLRLSGPTTHLGVTTLGGASLEFGGGVSHGVGAVVGSGTLTIAPNTILTSDAVSVPSLSILGTHILRKNVTTSSVSKVSTLALAGAGTPGAWTGRLELSNNALIIEATTSNKAAILATLLDQIATGVFGVRGITSSSAQFDSIHVATYVVDNSMFGLTLFQGAAVDANSLIVTSTYKGDANLDRKVDVTDLGILATYYGQFVTKGLLQGDFDGSGRVDVSDLGALATNYGAGSGINGFPVGSAMLESPQVNALSVPEPISFLVLSLPLILLLTLPRPRAN